MDTCPDCPHPYTYREGCAGCTLKKLLATRCHKQRAMLARGMGNAAPDKAAWFRIGGCECGATCEWERAMKAKGYPLRWG